jgi:hypothetical protein
MSGLPWAQTMDEAMKQCTTGVWQGGNYWVRCTDQGVWLACIQIFFLLTNDRYERALA